MGTVKRLGFSGQGAATTHRLHSSSFLGLPYRILDILYPEGPYTLPVWN